MAGYTRRAAYTHLNFIDSNESARYVLNTLYAISEKIRKIRDATNHDGRKASPQTTQSAAWRNILKFWWLPLFTPKKRKSRHENRVNVISPCNYTLRVGGSGDLVSSIHLHRHYSPFSITIIGLRQNAASPFSTTMIAFPKHGAETQRLGRILKRDCFSKRKSLFVGTHSEEHQWKDLDGTICNLCLFQSMRFRVFPCDKSERFRWWK